MNTEVQNKDEMNIELSPDTIFGYLMTTQAYSEEQDDKRKRPLFFWKAYHFYPIVSLPEDEDADEEDDEMVALLTEGGETGEYNYVPMNISSFRLFAREHPSFRIMNASDVFEDLNII